MVIYIIIFILLFLAELLYFRIADKCNIIDKPNERSSHSSVVLRGGGIIFPISMLLWTGLMMFLGKWHTIQLYLPFLIGLISIAAVSFIDDIRSLPDSARLVAQFVAVALMLWTMHLQNDDLRWWSVILILIVGVGIINVFNFMDGINGITAGYSLSVLVPLFIMLFPVGFIEGWYLPIAILGVLAFAFFNFRPKGKARCFAGDVGSVSIAFIILLPLANLIFASSATYLVFLLVYGIDGCLTILHRIMLHENLGAAHRKHAYQIMANELKMGHLTVSLIYMLLQLAISLGFIFLCPDTVVAHWVYLMVAGLLLALAYVLFMKKYYHLHEEYLAGLRK